MMTPVDIKSDADIRIDRSCNSECCNSCRARCCGCLSPRQIVQVFLPRRLDIYIFERDGERGERK
jgi:hypothetical protein